MVLPERMKSELGLAHLSLLNTEPPRLIELASAAGFDFVGLRVRPATDSETRYDLQPGSGLLRETLHRMADTGIHVKDIEFLVLDGTDQRHLWLQMFEAGQALGASSMTVTVADSERQRVQENLMQMVSDGKAYGITPTLEPISYQAVRSLPHAGWLAELTGVSVLVDTLHVRRFGGTAKELGPIADQVPMVQVCDAPAQAPPDRDSLVAESRSHRLPAGAGRLDPRSLINAIDEARRANVAESRTAEHVPVAVSAEVPNAAMLERLGEAGWVKHLYTTTRDLVGEQV